MKCPNCGGENSGNYCQFCGSEMPKRATPINITNYFYGNSDQSNAPNSGCCPKCGSSKIGFKRERSGTNAKSTSRKKYVGTGRKGTYNSTANYRTIGLCQSCGYTWSPNSNSSNQVSEKDQKLVLLIFGIVFIFPLPITILLLKNKKLNLWLRYGIIALSWILYFFVFWPAVINAAKKSGSERNISATAPTVISSSISTDSASESASETIETTTSEVLPTLYEYDDNINLYVNRFNAYNPDYVLTSEDMKKYSHHGTEHDDQIRFFRDGFEIVISGGALSSKVDVYVGYTATNRTVEEYEQMFIRFAKAYSPDLNDDTLKQYWKQLIDGSSSKLTEFDCDCSPSENFRYFKLSGEVK